MKGLDTNNLCSHGNDILAYLYNEMKPADRELFEVHLADCGTCIDDFAELSQSRYPVYEWKRLEFDPLPTPRFVMPLEAASVSWFDKLRASLASRPAFAFGSIAAIAVLASITAFVIISGSRGDSTLAQVEPVVTPAAPTPTSAPIATIADPEPDEVRLDEPKAVKAAAPASRPARREVKPKAARAPRRIEPMPTLSNTEDIQDDSLRLADIFEEIDTSES